MCEGTFLEILFALVLLICMLPRKVERRVNINITHGPFLAYLIYLGNEFFAISRRKDLSFSSFRLSFSDTSNEKVEDGSTLLFFPFPSFSF